MPSASEREWVQYRRGEHREAVLRDFREGLRALTNPDTEQAFTEDELRRATAHGSRFYREADAIDQILIGIQKRDEFFAQQIRLDRAGSGFLRTYHATLWGEVFLPAFGGSGGVTAHGTPGTLWLGSTTVPDAFAVTGTDPSMRRYQVMLSGVAAPVTGLATLTLVAIDGGDETNPAVGTLIKWTNPPPGSDPTAVVVGAAFTGGLDAETDADFAARVAARVRHKPASGNWAHLRAFARAASVSVEDAFIYPCAFYAGSVLVAITGKRGATAGPLGRVPSVNVLSTVRALLVPPASPLVPGRAHVVVVPVQTVASNLTVQIAQPLGSSAGWFDLEPFPRITGIVPVTITTVTTQLDFRVTSSAAGQLPQGVAGPLAGVHLMVWNALTSAFETLDVFTVQDLGAGVYRVILNTAPAETLTLGDYISPDMAARALPLTAAVVSYFDSLGPGEVIDLVTDERAVRAFRNPVPSEEYPSRAGQNVVTFIAEAMGAPVSDATLTAISLSTPTLPADPVDGPRLIVLGNFAVYPL